MYKFKLYVCVCVCACVCVDVNLIDVHPEIIKQVPHELFSEGLFVVHFSINVAMEEKINILLLHLKEDEKDEK